eukprot:g6281.t1
MMHLYRLTRSLHRTILEFFDGAIKKLKIEQEHNELNKYIEPWLEKLFPIYDADQDGSLNAKETSKLLQDFTGKEVSEEQCKEFLESIDEDNNALIECDELQHFVERGISLSEEEREQYSSRSKLHVIILEFFAHSLKLLKAIRVEDEGLVVEEVVKDEGDEKAKDLVVVDDDGAKEISKNEEHMDKKSHVLNPEEVDEDGRDDFSSTFENVALTPRIGDNYDFVSTFEESKFDDGNDISKDYRGRIRYYEQRLKKATEIAGEGTFPSQEACDELVTMYNQYALHLIQEKTSSLGDIAIAESMLKKAMILSRPSALLPNKEVQRRLRSITLNNKAILYKAKKMPHAALQCLDKALQVECQMANCPNPAGTHLNLCATLSDLGRHRAALTHAKCAIELIEFDMNKMGITLDQNATSSSKLMYGEKMDDSSYSTNSRKSSPKRAAIVNDEDPRLLLAIAYYNQACQEEHLGFRSKAAVTFQKALSIAMRDRESNSVIIEEIQRSIRQSTFKEAKRELNNTKKQGKSSPRSPKSPPKSPRRLERPVNSQDELNIILREAIKSNRSLFGMKLESPIDVFLAIDK